MKIVHIEDFFHPDAGYQINILPKYQVKQGHEVSIITSEIEKVPEGLTNFFGKDNIDKRDKEYTEKTGVKIYRLPLYKFLSGRAIFKLGLGKFVDTLNPDILYVHGNDTAVGILYSLKSKKLSYPVIFDSHMLDMASKNKFNKLFRFLYRSVITPIIKKEKLVVIRTQDDDYVERCLGIPLLQAPWISVGSDTMQFSSDKRKKNQLREAYNISENEFTVVYTGKLDSSKGGKFLAEVFKEKFNLSNGKEVVLVVVGNSTTDDYGKEMDSIFNSSENRILRFPTQKYMDLAKFYQLGDLSVFPKQCSLSFYDAQACGLPVVSEDNNINVERLRYNNGYNFVGGDLLDFRKKIIDFAEMAPEKGDEIAKNAVSYVQKNYNYEEIAMKYTDILQKVIDDYSKKGIGC
ncbi:glycosyl transferase [Bacillus cereus]|uniref:glycosyltransferase family 4 protein n=1 Tax=Bacillus sp. AW TaxID=2293329 RepID=UPI000BF41C59|nr:glycosyltransferase family 4 protein [Bacillus wiedmannii]PFI47445.1 glycosyl transferase [Bacillus cereus]RFB70551.1 glycosyltransferase [Bacillus sp. AW]PFQ94738.1 glycosyl transferase [Bacillus cereus]PGP34912.1 glycosyl transferase [Bacillus cereus]